MERWPGRRRGGTSPLGMGGGEEEGRILRVMVKRRRGNAAESRNPGLVEGYSSTVYTAIRLERTGL